MEVECELVVRSSSFVVLVVAVVVVVGKDWIILIKYVNKRATPRRVTLHAL